MRPVDAEVSQHFGDNPTANLPADSWLIQTFGNYQPNGHTGVDFACPIGTPVRSVGAGVVRHAGWYSGSYVDNPYWIAPSFAGYVLVIDHGSFVGIYAHLSHSPVTVGEGVDAGQVVAFSGNTGGSTGPHLHFEVLPDGWDFNNGMYGRVDPGPFMDAVSLDYAGTITPSEEDDLPYTPEQIKGWVAEAIQPMHDVTRQYLADRTKDGTLAVLNGTQAQEDVTRQYLADQTQAQQDVTRTYLADRIKEASPAEIADLVPAAIAQAVIDALAARLAGGSK